MIRGPSDGSVRQIAKSSDGRTDEAKAREVEAASGSFGHGESRGIALNHGSQDQAGVGSERSSPSETVASGLPTGSTKEKNLARLDRSREWLKIYMEQRNGLGSAEQAAGGGLRAGGEGLVEQGNSPEAGD